MAFPLPPIPALKVGAAVSGVLGAGAALAFGAVFFVSKVQGVYQSGYDAGVIEQTLAYQTAAIEAAEAARIAEEAREADTARRVAAATARATDAEKALAERIARERRNNAELDQCLSLDYPDHLRGFVRSGVLLQAPAAGHNPGRGREALAPVGPDGLRG